MISIHQLDKPASHNHGKWYIQSVEQGKPTEYLHQDGAWKSAEPLDTGYYVTRKSAVTNLQSFMQDAEDFGVEAAATWRKMWDGIIQW